MEKMSDKTKLTSFGHKNMFGSSFIYLQWFTSERDGVWVLMNTVYILPIPNELSDLELTTKAGWVRATRETHEYQGCRALVHQILLCAVLLAVAGSTFARPAQNTRDGNTVDNITWSTRPPSSYQCLYYLTYLFKYKMYRLRFIKNTHFNEI